MCQRKIEFLFTNKGHRQLNHFFSFNSNKIRNRVNCFYFPFAFLGVCFLFSGSLFFDVISFFVCVMANSMKHLFLSIYLVRANICSVRLWHFHPRFLPMLFCRSDKNKSSIFKPEEKRFNWNINLIFDFEEKLLWKESSFLAMAFSLIQLHDEIFHHFRGYDSFFPKRVSFWESFYKLIEHWKNNICILHGVRRQAKIDGHGKKSLRKKTPNANYAIK